MIKNFSDHAANERTFLAWNRTALALIATGVAATQLLPKFDVAFGRRLLGLPLIALFLRDQGLAISDWDLVIVGMDFREGQEAMAIPAVIDERRLQRRFDPGHLCEIDISLELLVLSGLEIKLLDPVPRHDRDPGLFPVARIDQHTHCHSNISSRSSHPSPGERCDPAQ